MTVLGIGLDVVDVPQFASHLDEPGNGLRRLFSERELRQVRIRARLKGDTEVVHLAARWAAKEAVHKAWSTALGERPAPYSVDNFPWAELEILADERWRPRAVLRENPRTRLYDSLGFIDPQAPTKNAIAASQNTLGSQDKNTFVAHQGDSRLQRVSTELVWHLSLSHDGPIASAYALLECRDCPAAAT